MSERTIPESRWIPAFLQGRGRQATVVCVVVLAVVAVLPWCLPLRPSGLLAAAVPAVVAALVAAIGLVVLVQDGRFRRRHDDLMRGLSEHRERNEVMQAIAEGTSGATGEEFFQMLVKVLATNLRVRYVCVSTVDGGEDDRAQVLAFWSNGRLGETFEFDLSVTPCADVAFQGTCLYASGAKGLFPRCGMLQELSVESFLGTPIRGNDGKTIGVVAVMDDEPMDRGDRNLGPALEIFAARAGAELARMRFEEEIRDANVLLEHRVKEQTKELVHAQQRMIHTERMAALGQIVATVSHEVNTPLGISVTASSHLHRAVDKLRRRFEGGSMTRSSLEDFLALAGDSCAIVDKNLKRAADLMQSFKKVAVDQSSGDFREIDLKEYLEEVLRSINPALKRSNMDLTIECPEGLTVLTHPGAVSQIMTNLAINAMVHAYPEKEPGRAVIRVTPGDAMLTVEFEDYGVGMRPEIRERIFEPFFTTRRDEDGSGLGLHIVSNLVSQALQGEITCSSTLGVGTCFRMKFHRTQAETGEPVVMGAGMRV